MTAAGPAAGTCTARRISEALGQPAPTAEQAAVIAAPLRPALVVAGAGAGKTETMAARVVWLVANGHVSPEHVLGLTFTRKAARQLSDRVRARLRRLAGSGLLDELDPGGERKATVLATEPTVLTYHAYAGRLVGEHGLRLPVEPGASVLTETAAWRLAHRVVASWDGDLDTDKTPATVTGYVLALAAELAEHLVEPERLAGHAERLAALIEDAPPGPRQRKRELPVVLRDIVAAQRTRAALVPLVLEYARAKRREGVVDFADEMAMAARLAAEHPEVAEAERGRYRAVLLDEYQDTGHAQRVLLRSLFGGPSGTDLPVTAVGDPAQAIYGWRGASAANLPRFTTDFPSRSPGPPEGGGPPGQRPSDEYALLTSFRNPPQVLALANAVAVPLRAAGLRVEKLRAREGAPAADIACGRFSDVVAEREWVAGALARRWHDRLRATGKPPTAAVLLRRRADMTDIAAALRARGLPVEVVGLGGLLDEPEVRDLVSTLRVLVDPLAGTAAARLLTGARWRLGAADFVALYRRARALASAEPGATPRGTLAGVDVDAALPGEHAEQVGLADAVDDPGDPGQYSEQGYLRIERLRRELAALRGRMGQSLPDLVADVERTLGLDIEALARRGSSGRAHLDAFARVVAEFAQASPTASVSSLLDYLATAERAEDGLARGEVEVAEDRVQVLTMHAAKGLEWDVVAVPHLAGGVFPGRKRAASWLRTVQQLPVDLRGDAADLPVPRLAAGYDRKELADALGEHEEEFEARRLTEERRLLYVALTRSAGSLLCSGHWWSPGARKPRAPSRFLTELYELLCDDPDLGTLACWADQPEEGADNPLSAEARTLSWPADPLAGRRREVLAGARLVTGELARLPGAGRDSPGTPPESPGTEAAEWERDVDVLLAERAAAGTPERVTLPSRLSVSRLVELSADPEGLARRLRRPLPFEPSPASRRGTAFHRWLERHFGATALLDVDELPGAADEGALPDSELDRLREAFLASAWAGRTPEEVEVPFETTVEGIVVRGRMDAVFADPGGGWTVVDWKTGAVPEGERLRAASVQLAVYRLAWAALRGVDPADVRAAFHYVGRNHTLAPVDLLDTAGLRGVIRSVPTR